MRESHSESDVLEEGPRRKEEHEEATVGNSFVLPLHEEMATVSAPLSPTISYPPHNANQWGRGPGGPG